MPGRLTSRTSPFEGDYGGANPSPAASLNGRSPPAQPKNELLASCRLQSDSPRLDRDKRVRADSLPNRSGRSINNRGALPLRVVENRLQRLRLAGTTWWHRRGSRPGSSRPGRSRPGSRPRRNGSRGTGRTRLDRFRQCRILRGRIVQARLVHGPFR